MDYGWSNKFLEAGKKRLSGDKVRAATTYGVRDLRRETGGLKEVVADLVLENRLLKKHNRGWKRQGIRYPACKKLGIIRLFEQFHLPVRGTLGARPSSHLDGVAGG